MSRRPTAAELAAQLRISEAEAAAGLEQLEAAGWITPDGRPAVSALPGPGSVAIPVALLDDVAAGALKVGDVRLWALLDLDLDAEPAEWTRVDVSQLAKRAWCRRGKVLAGLSRLVAAGWLDTHATTPAAWTVRPSAQALAS